MLFAQKRNTTAKGPKMNWDATTNIAQMDGLNCLLLNNVSTDSFLQYPDEPT